MHVDVAIKQILSTWCCYKGKKQLNKEMQAIAYIADKMSQVAFQDPNQ